MKKLITVIIALCLCVSMAMPVFASEFVPSIEMKDIELVTTTNEQNEVVIGYIVDSEGNVIEELIENCLVLTPLSKANESELIPENAKEKLLLVYEDLKNGNMKINYNELFEATETNNMLVRELFDISWLCEDHPVVVAQDGVQVTLKFALNIEKDAEVYVTTYKDEQWKAIVKAVNNGDGTITCTFEDFCPVAISVCNDVQEDGIQTGDSTNTELWWVMLTASATLLIVLVFVKRKIK